MLQNRQVFQTADTAGGSQLRLIGGATNEWQISRCSAPHARQYTRCWFLIFSCWNLNQTFSLTGGSPFCSISEAINVWQILQGAAPHARHYTRCWFLDHYYNLQTAEHVQLQKNIQRSFQIAKQQHESWWRTFRVRIGVWLSWSSSKAKSNLKLRAHANECFINKKNSCRKKENKNWYQNPGFGVFVDFASSTGNRNTTFLFESTGVPSVKNKFFARPGNKQFLGIILVHGKQYNFRNTILLIFWFCSRNGTDKNTGATHVSRSNKALTLGVTGPLASASSLVDSEWTTATFHTWTLAVIATCLSKQARQCWGRRHGVVDKMASQHPWWLWEDSNCRLARSTVALAVLFYQSHNSILQNQSIFLLNSCLKSNTVWIHHGTNQFQSVPWWNQTTILHAWFMENAMNWLKKAKNHCGTFQYMNSWISHEFFI
jgi:hypothetical protein